jgi:hypothetical protein
LGEVASGADDVLDAIDRAFKRHRDVIARQAAAVVCAFGQYDGAIERAAEQLLYVLPAF